jgi:hypothetical protein
MGLPRDLVEIVVEHADKRLPAGLYAAISVATDRTRVRFRNARRPFFDPDGQPVSLNEADDTAAWVIRQSSFNAAAFGGLTSLAGAVTIPYETLGSVVSVVRLAQRLAIVYGFDPETDRGQVAVWRALAAGLDIDLPAQGPMQVRLRDLPPALVPRPSSAGAWLARQVVRRSAWGVVASVTRFVPVLASGVSVVGARRRTGEIGDRMRTALRRLAEIPPELRFMEEAVEV